MPLKLIRVTTIPLSLEKLLEGQLTYMSDHYDVIAVSAEKDRLEKYGLNNGVRTFHVEMTREITPVRDIKALWRFYSFLKKEQPLIVHSHTPKAGIIGMLAARMANVPIRLHTVAGMPLMETKGIKRKILLQVEKLTYSCATKVFPNSQGLKSFLTREKLVNPGKIQVLGEGSSNGIDTDFFDPQKFSRDKRMSIRQELKIPLNDIVFIFIGRLVSDKGINELVQAFIKAQKVQENLTLLLVGSFEHELDPLDNKNIQAIEEHPKIRTTGYQEDVRPFLAVADVLAFPSYREGFPNVVMQAASMGLPAIVTDIIGCNELVGDEKNGIIIPVKNEEALLRAMNTLARDPELRRRLALNSRKEIVRKYERKEFWRELLREYKKLESQKLKS
ncbi:glycosyltransferase family 4 protein [Salinimicrobium soli]|uniref:glycosyltransferase family 4 protein n=1 Tax=Salinimicrobium soli TaxID=1254399 RepID=UPI003AAE30F4